MFVHQNQLQYLLRPDQYFSNEQLEVEIDQMFRPGWHFVCTKTDMPKSGDFRVVHILGEPVHVKNFDGSYHAFLNICPHRHTTLTKQECGNSPKIRCQYHGWEFNEEGKTGRIPDARCFRPWDRDNSRLHRFRLETCGDTIWVSITEDGPTLREYLGDFFDDIAYHFSGEWQQCWAWEHEYPSNWKLPLENTVETYHLPFLHGGAIGTVYPSEQAQEHILNENFSTVKYDTRENKILTWASELSVKLLRGEKKSNLYVHNHLFPNHVFSNTDLFAHMQSYLPTSPTTCKTIIRMYSYRGSKWGAIPAVWSRWVAMNARAANRKIQLEDAAVFASQQAGVKRSRFPGCIGTREERIYAFQKYIYGRTGGREDVTPKDLNPTPEPASSVPV